MILFFGVALSKLTAVFCTVVSQTGAEKNIFHQVANLVYSCAILASPRKITCPVKLSIIATFFSYLLIRRSLHVCWEVVN